MPTQSEQNDRNQQSKDRVSDGQTIRDRRKAERAVKSRRKELLQGATSTSQRRDIKGGIYDISTTSTDVDNRQGEGETIDDNSIDSAITHTGGISSSSSGGLPEYPGNAPSIDIKAPLVWDDINEEARWLVGETQSASDPKTYLDIFGHDPSTSGDIYSLNRYEILDVVICKDGEPVNGQILFFETEEA